MDVLKDILDNLNDSIIIVDGFGQVVLFNNEALRIQKSVSEKPIEIGGYFVDLMSEQYRPTVQEILKTVKRQKKPLKNFGEYKAPLGNSIFLEINFVPVLGPRRELRYINVITQDITARKVFEKRARVAAADVSNLLEHAHALICSVDSRGYIVDWNNHCAEVTGLSRREVLSRKFSDALMNESHVALFDALICSVLQNKPVANCELPLKTRKGELLVVLSASPRTSTNGEVVGATLVGQDITELTSYRRSLDMQVENKTAALQQVLQKEKEAVEMRSRFVSIASHEFRTPLSSIDFAASFIKQNAATIGKKKLNEKVKMIEKHVSHMSHLLDDVLNFSKNDYGRIRLITSEICLEEFIMTAVEEVTCGAKHSHHICVSSNKLGFLVTDEKLLRNIVINLLSNAIKFSPGKEEISLNVLDHGEAVTIEVRDEGMGIPESETEKIFEPFIRGKAATALPGTGLGLSIVKKAVELLDGHINVESTVGVGSLFSVTIPRSQRLN